MVVVNKNIMPMGLADPTPPSGSDYDQTTLGYNIDAAIIVAGEMNGDPAQEHYVSQGFINQRPNLTGFGAILGYYGAVTEPIIVGIATTSQKTNSPQDPNGWTAAGVIDPAELSPEYWYYITLTLNTPIALPASTVHWLICATNESWTDDGVNQKGWVWGGITSAPYPQNVEAYDGTSWNLWSGIDTAFYTFTEVAPSNCADYTNQTDCEANSCYWCGTYCQSTPCGTTPCADYTNQTDCQNNGCYWCADSNTCQSTPCGSGGTCEDYQTQAECSANGCYWYAKYFWEEPSCHTNPQNMMMDYLPFIIGGVGLGVIILAVMSKGGVPQPPPQYYYPQYNYPPPQPYGAGGYNKPKTNGGRKT